MQEAVISSPWMVPQNHLSFSKASISRLNPAAGTLPAFYLLPERASENTSKINMSFRPWFSSRDDDKTLNQQVSQVPKQHAEQRHTEKAGWKLHQRPGFLPEAPGGATMAPWIAMGTLSGLPTPTALDFMLIILRSSKRNDFHWHNM